MLRKRGLRETKGALALIAMVAFMAGIIPLGAFAFAFEADEARDTPEIAIVDGTAADKGEAPDPQVDPQAEPQKNDDQAQKQDFDKSEKPDPALLQDTQKGAGNAKPDTETQEQEEQANKLAGEQTFTAPATNEEDAESSQQSEGDGPDAGDAPLHTQGGVVSDGLSAPTITVTAPVAGTTSATAPVVSAESGAGYSVANTKWCDADGRPLANPVTFEAGQTYYLSTQLTPTAMSGTESYFRTSNVTCNGGTVVRMFNSSRMMNGRIVFASLEPVISVTATGTAEDVRIRWGSNSYNGDVRYSYTANNGTQISGTQAGSSVFRCKNGSTVTLTAAPKANYAFVGWFSANYDTSGGAFAPSGDALSANPTFAITATSSIDQSAYCAVFAPKPVVCGLFISPDGPNGSATIEYTDHRTGLPNSFTLHGHSLQAVRAVYGTDVTVTAVPDEGYSLVGWFEDPDDKNSLVSTDTTYTYTATEQTILMAEFEHVHTWGAWTTTTEPTCTKPGTETRTCSFCGEEDTREVAALGHDWDEGKLTTAPTCTDKGVRTFTCTRCGETKTEAVAALGHDWGAWEVTKEATEAADGEEVRTCSRCDEKETRTVPHLVVEYRNTAGDGATWTKGSGETLTFTFNRNINNDAAFSHFTGIQVDGAAVGDSNYSAVEGSVVVMLSAGYLEGLSAGDHTITALFDDGNSASARFAVKAAAKAPAAGNGGSGGVKPANAARTSGTTARNGLPGTGDPMRAFPGLLAATVLCGAAMLIAASRMRPTRSRGKHARK